MEDLRIHNLILLLFEDLLGLAVNFQKSCLFATIPGTLPFARDALTLNYSANLLQVTYFGIPLFGRRPRKQDWLSLTQSTNIHLASWNTSYLSLGGLIVLVNSVLSTLPTYWMSVFELPKWVLWEIDRISCDFLWSEFDIFKPKCLVAWSLICKSKEQGAGVSSILLTSTMPFWGNGGGKPSPVKVSLDRHHFVQLGLEQRSDSVILLKT